MKNNKADILTKIDSITTQAHSEVEALKKSLFELYDSTPIIKEFLNRVENIDKPDSYQFNSFDGYLESVFEPTFNVKDFPFIDEYFNENFIGHYDSKNNQFLVCHGPSITVDWNHDRNSYFVYDRESRKPIIESRRSIEGHPTISENAYVAAKIAQYQNKQGVFNDVVVIDYYGHYLKHFDLMAPLIGHGIENLDDKARINDLILTYETEVSEND